MSMPKPVPHGYFPVERLDGRLTPAKYVRHLRTLVSNNGCGSNLDLDAYVDLDGIEFQATSPSNDGRAIPQEIGPDNELDGFR